MFNEPYSFHLAEESDYIFLAIPIHFHGNSAAISYSFYEGREVGEDNSHGNLAATSLPTSLEERGWWG